MHELSAAQQSFLWAILAISHDRDPAWADPRDVTVIRDQLHVATFEQLLAYTAEDFQTRSHPAYNHYRLCLIARVGLAAGLLSDAQSSTWALREAVAIQQTYSSWYGYACGYLEGHLEHCASQGDAPAQLARCREQIFERTETLLRTVWSIVPFFTPLG